MQFVLTTVPNQLVIIKLCMQLLITESKALSSRQLNAQRNNYQMMWHIRNDKRNAQHSEYTLNAQRRHCNLTEQLSPYQLNAQHSNWKTECTNL